MFDLMTRRLIVIESLLSMSFENRTELLELNIICITMVIGNIGIPENKRIAPPLVQLKAYSCYSLY